MINLVGYEVTHKAFGSGIVRHADNKYVTVSFETCEKTFVYPDAFNGFMTIADGAVATQVAADVAASIAEKKAEEAHRAAERERQMQKGIVIPGGKPLIERTVADFIPVLEESGEEL